MYKVVITDDEALFHKLRQTRAQLLSPVTLAKEISRRIYLIASSLSLMPALYTGIHFIEQLGLLNRFVKYYDDSIIDMPDDWNTSMTNVEARVGLVQLQKYHDVIAFSQQAAEKYTQLLSGNDSYKLPPLVNGATYSHYTLRTPHREQIIHDAAQNGVQLGRLIEYVIPKMKAYENRSGCKGEFPVASRMSKEALNLPIWVGVDVERVASVVKDVI